MIKIMTILIISLLISGCAGTGFNKKATLTPDEFWLSVDMQPEKKMEFKNGRIGEVKGSRWYPEEITGGLKWKFK